MTGFSPRAVSNWSQGSKPSSLTARRLTEIKRLFAALEKLVSPEAIAQLSPPVTAPTGGGGATPKPALAPTYVPASALRAKCGLPYIGSEADLDQWLAAVRNAALAELEKGHRISL